LLKNIHPRTAAAIRNAADRIAISRVMEQVNSHNPDAVFVDGTGIGWGVHAPRVWEGT